MSTTRFRRVDELFRAASQLEPRQRAEFLEGRCGDDHAMLSEVMALLDADARPDGVLDRPALGAGISVATLQSAGGDISGPLPASIGRYRILHVIGVGGMGVVYEAEQDNPRRTVALKVINSALASRSMLRRFEHEAQVLGRLQHPGIAQIFEAGTFNTGAGEQPYFAMELVRGRPLHEYIRIAAPDIRARLELIARIADAVEHAHQRGVIHRDLKPSNILVAEDDASSLSAGESSSRSDSAPIPRILDFGVARLSDHDVQSATLRTEVGQLIGTIRYMSPEQAAGDPNEIDTRSDVYSIGVIAYEVLTGRLPYPVQDKLVHEAVRIIREDEPTPLSTIDRALRGDVATIIAKALEKEKSQRYQTASALAADIRRHLRDEPIDARPQTTFYQLRKFARRNRGIVSGVAAGIALLLVGTVVAIWQAVEARRAEGIAQRQANRALIGAAAVALDASDPIAAADRLAEIPDDARGWEWRYLNARLDQSVAVMPQAGPLVGLSGSADGQNVIAISRPGAIVWIDPRVNRETGHADLGIGEIRLAVFSADGSRVALLAGSSIYALDTSASPLAPLLAAELPSRPTRLAISDDGSTIAGALSNQTIAIIRPDNPQPIFTQKLSRTNSIALSHDGARLAAASHDLVVVFDAATGAPTARHTIPNSGLAVDISPDGREFVTGGMDKQVYVIDAESGTRIHTRSGHTGSVIDVAYSSDGALIGSVGIDATIRIWRRGETAPASSLNMPAPDCVSLDFMPGDQQIITRHKDGSLRLWETAAPNSLRGHESFVYDIAFDPTGTRIASASWDQTIRLWTCEPANASRSSGASIASSRLSPFHPMAERWRAVIIAAAASLPACASGISAAARWCATCAELGEITSLSISPDGKWLACTRTHSPTALWSLSNLSQPPLRLKDETRVPSKRSALEFIHASAFSPDGELLATGAGDGVIRLWRVADLTLLRELRGHKKCCRNVAFSPGGRTLASASDDFTAKVWDVSSGRCIMTLAHHRDCVYAVAFTPDGRRLATGSRDTTIRLWDTATGEDVLPLRGHGDYVRALAFSPDGSMLASGSGDGTIRLWDTLTMHERRASP